MKLFFIFPISGPNNGVKVISNHIRNSLFINTNISINELNTAQAKDFSNFGKFNFDKILSFYTLFKKLFSIIPKITSTKYIIKGTPMWFYKIF